MSINLRSFPWEKIDRYIYEPLFGHRYFSYYIVLHSFKGRLSFTLNSLLTVVLRTSSIFQSRPDILCICCLYTVIVIGFIFHLFVSTFRGLNQSEKNRLFCWLFSFLQLTFFSKLENVKHVGKYQKLSSHRSDIYLYGIKLLQCESNQRIYCIMMTN